MSGDFFRNRSTLFWGRYTYNEDSGVVAHIIAYTKGIFIFWDEQSHRASAADPAA